MMKIYSSKILLSLILFYLIYMCVVIMNHKVIIADDLSNASRILSDNNHNFLKFVKSFLDTAMMAPRPVSAFVTAVVIFVSQYNLNYYFTGLFLFPISCFLLYYVLRKNISTTLASVIVTLYGLSYFGSSVQFSCIMLNSNLAVIFYLLSFHYLKNHSQNAKNFFISSVFFALSVFSYEIFVPCILINFFLVKKLKDKLVYLFFSLGLVILYRKGVQPYLFSNSYDRENVASIFNIQKDTQTIILIVKMIVKDSLIVFYKTFFNIHKLNIMEWILGIGISASTYFAISKAEKTYSKKELSNILKISLFGLIISFSIFFFSTYRPNLFGFENRNLGAVRLFCSGVIFSIIMILLYNAKQKITAAVFSILILLLFLSNVSIKNAWIFANDYNNNLFSDLSSDLKGKTYTSVSIDYNTFDLLKNNKNFILREPTFFNNWEALYLCKKHNIDANRIKIYNIERKKKKVIYQYPSRKFVINDK